MLRWHQIYPKLEQAIVPGLRHPQFIYKDFLKKYAGPGCLWLDAGCGRGIFPEWMRNDDRDVTPPGVLVIGVDADIPSLLDNRSATHCVAGNMEQAPFKPDTFDLITANMVVEHIADPPAALRNIHQLLKPNGLFIFHTPNLFGYQAILSSLIPDSVKHKLIWHLEGRKAEDVFPTHYRMNTPSKITRLAQDAGFRVVDLVVVASTAETHRLGPLAIFELIGIRILNWRIFRNLRSNIVALLQRVPEGGA